jgi:hypothetical protein
LKWVTREGAKVDRVACPWLIRRFVDPDAQFLFVAPDKVAEVALREGATPFDTEGAVLGHRGKDCSFDAIVHDYHIKDPAVLELARIVRAADVASQRAIAPEGPGLELIADGFRRTSKDDHQNLERQFHVYDALYAAVSARIQSHK